ncbi:hypothetical protein Btru_078000 [Bulinus truncatus]|nr:hypothetical protein Btru_078000 [Bulinus truncatus]
MHADELCITTLNGPRAITWSFRRGGHPGAGGNQRMNEAWDIGGDISKVLLTIVSQRVCRHEVKVLLTSCLNGVSPNPGAVFKGLGVMVKDVFTSDSTGQLEHFVRDFIFPCSGNKNMDKHFRDKVGNETLTL